MERRTLVPDAGEVALDQLMVENNTESDRPLGL